MGQTLTYIWPRKTIKINEEEFAIKLLQCRNCVVLTGAGASAESNVPTFRDPYDGIWRRHNITDCGTLWGFKKHPEKLWFLISDCIRELNPVPNPTHHAIAKLQKLGKVTSVITQNIDNLHQDAGTKNVIEYHGNLMNAECMNCGNLIPLTKSMVSSDKFRQTIPPHCAKCNGIHKPTVILFGERIPSETIYRANQAIHGCDLLLVIGTSANVAPCSSIPYSAQRQGATVIEVNIEQTSLTNRISEFFFHRKSSQLQEVVALVEAKLQSSK